MGNDIYQVIARYLEMNGKPYVMELVHRLDEDALTDLEEKQYLIEQLTGYNEKLYQDCLLYTSIPKGCEKQCDRCAVCATRRRRSRTLFYICRNQKKEENIMRFTLDYDQYAALARQTAAEGCVLLKNEKEALPIRKGETVSVFGRIAFTYYKSGTGSGGMVNAPYRTNILDSLKECEDISVNEELEAVYQDWIRENPFDMGEGWAQEPWSQKEMPVSEALAQKAAASSDLAVVVLGRTAGERCV